MDRGLHLGNGGNSLSKGIRGNSCNSGNSYRVTGVTSLRGQRVPDGGSGNLCGRARLNRAGPKFSCGQNLYRGLTAREKGAL